MPSSSEQPALPEKKKSKWLRPIVTVIVLLVLLFLLTDGDVLKSFTYSNF